MLQQHVMGVINLSLPIVILYNIYPIVFFERAGKCAIALCTGLYLWYRHKQNLDALTTRLSFRPTDQWKQILKKYILECSQEPANIQLFYAYTDEALAIAADNSIIIDPLTWSSIKEDPEALKVIEIITSQISPSFSESKKIRMQKAQNIFSPQAQAFIFKHELGHIVRNYSQKKLCIIFLIGTISAYTGITLAIFNLASGGLVAICIGMLAGGLTDLFLSYFSNATFKAYEEKQADMFAIQYSSEEEIEAAADFFEKHQDILDTYPENYWLSKIPSIILSGHLNGKKRAALLRSHL
jgi:hypothetical protein